MESKECSICGKELKGMEVQLGDITLCQNCSDRYDLPRMVMKNVG